jgi:hypothetical protein
MSLSNSSPRLDWGLYPCCLVGTVIMSTIILPSLCLILARMPQW